MEGHDVQPEEGPQVSVISFMHAEAGGIGSKLRCLIDILFPEFDGRDIELESICQAESTASGDTRYPKEYLVKHRADSSAILHNVRKIAGHGPQGRLGKRTFSQQKGFVEEAAAFRQGCRSGDSPTPMTDFGTVTRLTFAAMESLRTGDPVSLALADRP